MKKLNAIFQRKTFFLIIINLLHLYKQLRGIGRRQTARIAADTQLALMIVTLCVEAVVGGPQVTELI